MILVQLLSFQKMFVERRGLDERCILPTVLMQDSAPWSSEWVLAFGCPGR